MTKEQGLTLKVGDVVQQGHKEDSFFDYCFIQVTEVKPWGIQGFVPMPKARGVMPSQAYTRAEWADIEYVGKATFVSGVIDEENSA